jgi:hypothetical protein
MASVPIDHQARNTSDGKCVYEDFGFGANSERRMAGQIHCP